MGNWLYREQAEELKAVPGQLESHYVIVVIPVGCALRWRKLVS